MVNRSIVLTSSISWWASKRALGLVVIFDNFKYSSCAKHCSNSLSSDLWSSKPLTQPCQEAASSIIVQCAKFQGWFQVPESCNDPFYTLAYGKQARVGQFSRFLIHPCFHLSSTIISWHKDTVYFLRHVSLLPGRFNQTRDNCSFTGRHILWFVHWVKMWLWWHLMFVQSKGQTFKTSHASLQDTHSILLSCVAFTRRLAVNSRMPPSLNLLSMPLIATRIFVLQKPIKLRLGGIPHA